MKLIHQAKHLVPRGRGACLALGMFDGVHLGHQAVISQMLADARGFEAVSLVITFDRHPNTVVAPHRAPLLIYPLAQRLRAIESLGIEAALLIHFDQAFSEQPGEVFVAGLARDLGRIASICVGSNFTFGCRRTGNVGLLKSLGKELGFAVHDVPRVSCRGDFISSTRIREAIQTGDLALASEMLGRPYSVSARVTQGRRLGQKLGFPTANLDIAGLATPPPGVYAGRVQRLGAEHRAVANLGRRPTVAGAGSELCLEVHLMDFQGGLYGEELEFRFAQRLRDEQKFASLDALRGQIALDVAAARRVLD